MINKLTNKVFSLLFIAIIICFVLAFSFPFSTHKTSKISRNFKVVIDAGHGGIDGGSEGSLSKVKESKLNLEIAIKLKKSLEKVGFIVVMTRESDIGLYGDTSDGFKVRDLKKRVQIINENKPDLAVSIHLNKYSKEYRRGAQVFYSKNNSISKNLANDIQFYLNLLKESKKMYDALIGDYYILNNSNSPAVIVECGFLSNNEEEKLLQESSYQTKLADAITNGILKFLST